MQKYVCFIFLNFYCLPQVTLTDKNFSNFILSIKTIGDYKKIVWNFLLSAQVAQGYSIYHYFSVACCRLNNYRSGLILRNLPCSKKSLVTPLLTFVFIGKYIIVNIFSLAYILIYLTFFKMLIPVTYQVHVLFENVIFMMSDRNAYS